MANALHAVTQSDYRFALRRPIAGDLSKRSLVYERLSRSDCDRSQARETLTGQRTPNALLVSEQSTRRAFSCQVLIHN